MRDALLRLQVIDERLDEEEARLGKRAFHRQRLRELEDARAKELEHAAEIARISVDERDAVRIKVGEGAGEERFEERTA